jgi:hypothetical protein
VCFSKIKFTDLLAVLLNGAGSVYECMFENLCHRAVTDKEDRTPATSLVAVYAVGAMLALFARDGPFDKPASKIGTQS